VVRRKQSPKLIIEGDLYWLGGEKSIAALAGSLDFQAL
jgi:hypothetical protein